METVNKTCTNSLETLDQATSFTQDNALYYGIFIPLDVQSPESQSVRSSVFQNKSEVIQVAKQYKKARFKAFSFYHEAADFAVHGKDCANNNDFVDSMNANSVESPMTIGEKPIPFKVPRPQDFVAFRKSIEKGEYEFVKRLIWKNPLHLIGRGDAPAILFEGPRFNALHIACKAKNAQIVNLILSTVSDIEFVKLLYGDDNLENCQRRAETFLDLYLNTPDKGLGETPLHFACKFGASEVIQVLVSYPQLEKEVLNKYSQTPKMIICDRCTKDDKIITEISELLDYDYYVPVLRAEDNSLPPMIGEPFSPNDPPVLNSDPTSPPIEIHAYAGPMNKDSAEKFRKVWKHSPRSLSLKSPNIKNRDQSIGYLKYKDPAKGLEIVGKHLANQFHTSWKEYWPFLDSFIDITTTGGLDLLEEHLKSKRLDDFKGTKNVKNGELSTISDLCRAMNNCNLNSSYSYNDGIKKLDSEQSFYFYLCLEKACEVFANRISADLLNFQDKNLLNVLISETKQLEVMLVSYLEDSRFSDINFNCVHNRLAQLICYRLSNFFQVETTDVTKFENKLEHLFQTCSTSLDCFSSDDEAGTDHKRTPLKRQMICLLSCVIDRLSSPKDDFQEVFTQEECRRAWKDLPSCRCIFNLKKSRMSFKKMLKSSGDFQNGSFCENNSDIILNFGVNEIRSSSDDNFYTPPSSPSRLRDDSDSEDFDDAETSVQDIFVEGTQPSQTDLYVYNALTYSNCLIDKDIYPNIYYWKHCIEMYTDGERQSWKNQPKTPCVFPSPGFGHTSTPNQSDLSVMNQSNSWLRVTGNFSPKRNKMRRRRLIDM